MSRLRKVDKAILDHPIDTIEQELIIDDLKTQFLYKYHANKKYLVIIMLVQIPFVSHLSVFLRSVNYFSLVSILLSLVNMYYEEGRELAERISIYGIQMDGTRMMYAINGLNGVLCLVLVLMAKNNLVLIVPGVDFAISLYMRKWYWDTVKELGVLQGLKYEFKSV